MGKRARRRLGVRSYLFAVLSLVAALPVILLGSLLAQRWARAEVEHADRTTLAAATSLASRLEQTARSYVRAVQSLAAQVEAHGSLDRASLSRMLEAHQSRYPEFYGWYVADAQGLAIVNYSQAGASFTNIDYSDRDYFKQVLATRQAAVSRVQVGKASGVANVQIAAPIFSRQGALLGIAEGSINLNRVAKQAASTARGLSDGRVVVVDAEGRVVADTASTDSVVLRRVGHQALFADVTTPDGEIRHADDEFGTGVHAAAMAVSGPAPGWRVVAMKSAESVQRRARQAKWATAFASALALMTALGIAAVFSGWLAMPIRDLANGAVAITRGSASKILDPARSGPVEVAQLGSAMQLMVERLRSHADELESVVAQRTLELTTANRELEVLATALHHAGEAIEITDPDFRYVYVNPAFEKLTGYSQDEVRGKTAKELLRMPGYSDEFYAPIVEAARRGMARGSFVSRRKDGTPFEHEATLAAIRDDDGPDGPGQVRQWVALRRDVTELRRAQEALRVSDRMASVGTLAAGVAHEINNPLAYVISNLTYARSVVRSLGSDLPANSELYEALVEASEGADRVRTIVKDMKLFSRSDESETGAVDVNAALESALKMARNEIRHRAKLIKELDSVPLVLANQARLGQVFVNLLVNAAQAIEEGHVERNSIEVVSRQVDDKVRVEIRDSGLGMPKDVVERAFDPFFTTKDVGIGTGLGLSICHNIVRSLNGSISIDSQQGRGTTVAVEFPAIARPELTSESLTLASISPKASDRGKILVVDDDPNVAKGLKRILCDYDVELAFSGTLGLEALTHNRYDVVFCDLMMPDVTGMELHDAVRALRPEQAERMVFMTGGAFSDSARAFVSRDDIQVIEKPFEPKRVRQLVSIAVREHAA